MTMITLDLIPKTCWDLNLRQILTAKSWDFIRKQAYSEANYQCSICSSKGRLEAHESWDFSNGIISLRKIEALCVQCHQVRHFGLSQIRGLESECINHMMKTNNWDMQQIRNHIKESFQIYNMRSQNIWKLEIKNILSDNVQLKSAYIGKLDI